MRRLLRLLPLDRWDSRAHNREGRLTGLRRLVCDLYEWRLHGDEGLSWAMLREESHR